MSTTEDFQHRVIDFLHQQFPDSQEMQQDELYNGVSYLLEKASYYGLETEIELVNYVITGYLLGLNFDSGMPAAQEILTNPDLSGWQKADWLQSWAQQLLQTLEGSHPGEDNNVLSAEARTVDMDQYLHMQADAEPFAELAEGVIRKLMQGDATALRTHFSPNFLQQIGEQTFEQVCAGLLVPFFETAHSLGQSSTITYTTDSFGSTGFAFYRTVTEESTEKPFIIYMVLEDSRIVVANLVINKTYADMH